MRLSPLMTFDDIDRALSGWNQRLAAIADNLLELQGDPTYQVLTGTGGAPKLALTGQTAAHVLPALKSIETIFHQFALLQAIVEKSAQMRKDIPVFGRDQAMREIRVVLEGESIELPAAAISLGQRTLLSGMQGMRKVRPSQLLESMASCFKDARDAVTMVSGAWSELAQEVDAGETEMRALHALALAESCSVPSELHIAETLLRAIKAKVECDPLDARAELKAQLRPALEQAGHHLRLRAAVQQQIAAAHAMLERLHGQEHEIAAATATSHAKILACGPFPSHPQDGLESLKAWLDRLSQRRNDDRPEPIALGLRNWHKAAEALALQGEQTLRLCRSPLDTRSELRGRLGALMAKARAYGLAEDAALTVLAGDAEALLYAQPTDLARSILAIEAYERKLAVPAPYRQKASGSSEERQ
jgi:hypothetical protein